MYTQGRVKSIKIIPKTSGAVVEVAYGTGSYVNPTEEAYACVDLADTKHVVHEWLAEVFREQGEYFHEEPEFSDAPVKRRRKRKAKKP